MESLAEHSVIKSVQNITNLIKLDGCLEFLGCTITLSGPNMNELKLVKHALKKMIRLSRQLLLEYEYYIFFSLQPPNFSSQFQTPFLHYKHMDRDFLIFKEASFSKRGV